MSLRLVQDLTNEIDWVLDFVGVSDLFMLNDDSCVDYLVGHHDVD